MTFRRIVTGHNAAGRAIIQSDAAPTRVERIGADGPIFYEVWNTRATPAPIDRACGEFLEPGLILPPPPNGTRIRVLDIPPETDDIKNVSAETSRAHFAQIGMEEASTAGAGAPHPFMHRTKSIDYAIVIDGELTLIVDEGETLVRTGDIVVQRGTNHAWANRSGRNCRIAFILVDGQFIDGLE